MLIYKQRYKPRTTREFTKSGLTVYDSADNTALNALTVYGKSEVVDGTIKSAGEGWATVDLGTLDWIYNSTYKYFYSAVINDLATPDAMCICAIYDFIGRATQQAITDAPNMSLGHYDKTIRIKNLDYAQATAFKNSLNGVILAYQLADPTQGNCIAVKTDNGTGINGTMAVFTTGTPLRGIPDTDVRDVMTWDGSAGTVTKVCNTLNISSVYWGHTGTVNNFFYRNVTGCKPNSQCLSNKYTPLPPCSAADFSQNAPNKSMAVSNTSDQIYIRDDDYTDQQDFRNANADTIILYELATSTTEQLTTAENTSIAGLRTFEPQTHAQNNAQTEMTVDYTIRVPTI